MSEPPPSATKTEDSGDFSTELNGDGDTTQPATDILNALDQLNTDTAPNSQEDVLKGEQEQQPKEEDVPQLPQLSEWETLRNRLRDSPHDPEGWTRLVELAENSGEIKEIKETYESLLKTYPNTASAQIAYLNHFMIPGSFSAAEDIFKRILRSSPSVDLWKFYLTYVRRRVNNKPGARDTVQKSFEFALNHVGQDKESGEIWMDYIQFLKSGETSSTWEEQQKMDALRKVYHRAVQIPIENIERLWSELEAFENNLNKITAKKFMADLSPSYMQARTVLRQLQRHIGPLFPPPPQSSTSRPALNLPALRTFNATERTLVGTWKNYLKWEESNPLELEEKDRATLVQRIQGVYRKAVIRMRFYSEIWYMSYVWNSSVGKHEDAVNILKEGIKANPASFLLNFAYAEVLEAKKDKDGVFAAFDNFTDVLRAELEAIEARVNSANSSFESNGSTKPLADVPSAGAPPVAATGLIEAGLQSNSSFNTQSSEEKPPKSKELADKRTEYGLVWIMYMRAARRVESQQTARALFGRCRKDRWIPWQVYEASALMEYHVCNAITVTTRIFEKGIELFGHEDIEIVLRYLNFLISRNDDANARALFEKVVGNYPPNHARPLWERWARYEYQYGDLESAQKLEKRIADVYPADPPIKRFAQRHMYLGTDAIAARDLGFAMTRPAGPGGSSNSLTRTDTQQSLLSNSNHQTGGGTNNTSHKRPASPDYRKRDDRPPVDYGSAHKRPRPMSPIRDRDRERWEGLPRRRVGSPSWDRDRDRDVPPPRRMEREREEEKGVVLPPVISWFVGQLPAPSAFDGPVFRTDDLMMLFRNAVIPSTTRMRSPPAPPGPPRGGGRPPPDYGPYQGPGGPGARGGRRY